MCPNLYLIFNFSKQLKRLDCILANIGLSDVLRGIDFVVSYHEFFLLVVIEDTNV